MSIPNFNYPHNWVKGIVLPHALPPWQTVYYHHRKWRSNRVWEKINDVLREQVRQRAGRQITPSAAIVDAQSVKTTLVKGKRGFDNGKKVNGRKRYIIVDTMGMLLMVIVTAASVQNRDGGYRGQPFADWVKTMFGWVWQVVKRNADVKGFHVLPRRWIVERTFGWLNN